MSSLNEKTERELRKKRTDLVNYIKLIDEELEKRTKVKPPSIVKQLFYGGDVKPTPPPPAPKKKKNTTTKSSSKSSTFTSRTVTPRSNIIRGTVADMKDILRKNNITFKSNDKKDDLIAKIRENGLINKVETKRVTEKDKREKDVRATVKEMKTILSTNSISFKSTLKKDELCALIRDNHLVRQAEALHMKNTK